MGTPGVIEDEPAFIEDQPPDVKDYIGPVIATVIVLIAIIGGMLSRYKRYRNLQKSTLSEKDRQDDEDKLQKKQETTTNLWCFPGGQHNAEGNRPPSQGPQLPWGWQPGIGATVYGKHVEQLKLRFQL